MPLQVSQWKPVEEEVELSLQGVAASVLVEEGEEGVLLCFLQEGPGLELLGQDLGQGGLAHPEGSFHHDVPSAGQDPFRHGSPPVSQ